jgi:hypothetical protein
VQSLIVKGQLQQQQASKSEPQTELSTANDFPKLVRELREWRDAEEGNNRRVVVVVAMAMASED